VELMDGVADTLPFLAEHHELTLCTKGDVHEQTRKIDLSGLRQLFAHCEIVKEKNPEAYQRLADVRGFDRGRTWMIGNSPKSDINPALEAGLGAVFVPHQRTWTLERAEIRKDHSRLRVVNSFRDLRDMFGSTC
jgi:putative hydrolase of the HAD superfamily